MKSLLTRSLVALLAGTMLIGISIAPTHADPKPKIHSSNMQSIYVCNLCHQYMSAGMARKMGYKDAMGHMMVKMGKAPAGYTDASKSKSSM